MSPVDLVSLVSDVVLPLTSILFHPQPAYLELRIY